MASTAIWSSLRRCFRIDSNRTLTYCQILHTQIRHASVQKKAAKAGAGVSKKKQLEVETDAKILCTRLCGGNIYKEGEDPVLGPDSAYPDWLWNLRTEKTPIPLEELSKEDPRYWRRLKQMTMRRNNKLKGYKQK